MIIRNRVWAVAVLLLLLCAWPARGQSFEVGGHVAIAQWSEFDGNDIGVGGRFTFRPLPMVGIDADLTWYPRGFPTGTVVPFSGHRFEGLFGATVGPKIGRIRPFAKAAAGFLNIGDAPVAFACIAIYPPPLACLMASDRNRPVYEAGGGIEVDATHSTFIRADVTERFLRYPGPSFDGKRQVRDADFFGGALRFTLGAGFRF